MKFADYVEAQVEPFGAMPMPHGTSWGAMRGPLVDLLIELSGERARAEQAHALAWAKTSPGSRVSAVCRECAGFDEAPTLPVIRGVWRTMFPPVSVARDCPHCGGAGWLIQDGPFDLTAAQPCNHTGMRKENLGIVLSGSQIEFYAREQEEAERRREAWRESEEFKRHTSPDRGLRKARVPLEVERYLG